MLNFSCLEGFNLSCRIHVLGEARKWTKWAWSNEGRNSPRAALLENFRMTQLRITVGFNTENTSKGYPQISHFNGIFHEINNPFGGTPIFGNLHIDWSWLHKPWHGEQKTWRTAPCRVCRGPCRGPGGCSAKKKWQVKADRTGYSIGGKIDLKNRYWIGG